MGANHSAVSHRRGQTSKPNHGFTTKSLKGVTPNQLAELGTDVAAAVQEAAKKRQERNPKAAVDSPSHGSPIHSSSSLNSTRSSGQLPAVSSPMTRSYGSGDSLSELSNPSYLNPHISKRQVSPSDTVADLDDILNSAQSPIELVASWSPDDWSVLYSWIDSQFRCHSCGNTTSFSSSSSSDDDISRGSCTVHPHVASLLFQLCTSHRMAASGQQAPVGAHQVYGKSNSCSAFGPDHGHNGSASAQDSDATIAQKCNLAPPVAVHQLQLEDSTLPSPGPALPSGSSQSQNGAPFAGDSATALQHQTLLSAGGGESSPVATSLPSATVCGAESRYDLNVSLDKLPAQGGGKAHRLRRTSSDNMLFIPELEDTPTGSPAAAGAAAPPASLFSPLTPTDDSRLALPPPAPHGSSPRGLKNRSRHNYLHPGSMQEQRLHQKQMFHSQILADARQLHQQLLLQRQQQRQSLQILQQQPMRISHNPAPPHDLTRQGSDLGPKACPYSVGGGENGGKLSYSDVELLSAASAPQRPADGVLGPASGQGGPLQPFNPISSVSSFTSPFAPSSDPSLLLELRNLRSQYAAQKKLLATICKAHDLYSMDETPNGCKVNDFLLASLLDLTQSKFGFVASVLYKTDGTPYMKTHAVSNVAWNRELRAWYMENAHKGLVFSNLKTLFGEVMTSGESVISNDPLKDPRSSGVPPGHPAMHSFLGVPAYMGPDMVGIFCLMNRPGGYDEGLVKELQPVVRTVAQVVYGIKKQKLRTEAENRLYSVLKVVREGMIAVAHSGFVTSLNPAARAMFKIPSTFGSISHSSSGSVTSSSSGHVSDENASPHLVEDALPFEDLFYSINSREDFMKLGLENHLNQVYPALGRRLDGSTLLVEISLSKGETAGIAFVAVVRQMEVETMNSL